MGVPGGAFTLKKNGEQKETKDGFKSQRRMFRT